MHRAKGSELAPWPQRLTAPPSRLDELGISAEKYQEDTVSFCNLVSRFCDLLEFFGHLCCMSFIFKHLRFQSVNCDVWNAGGLALESHSVLEADEIQN